MRRWNIRKAKKPAIKIELTAEQPARVKRATGEEVAAVTLKPEERVAPLSILGGGRQAGGADN